MSYAADDHEAIRRRLEEIAAERNLALTGSTVPVEDKTQDLYKQLWGSTGYTIFTAADYDPA